MTGLTDTKKNIIARLQKDMLRLQGFTSSPQDTAIKMGLGAVEKAFPNGCFPTGAIHEFISAEAEHTASTSGFIGGLLSALMKGNKACVWISRSRTLFPGSLACFGVEPHQIIFIDLTLEKDLPWAMEEALKCEGLAAVVGQINDISFTVSRRLQLAVEKSRVTGFLLRQQFRPLNTIACVARWKILPLPSHPSAGMPGMGFPRWQVELLKVRNGKPGNWQMEWAGCFKPVYTAVPFLQEEKARKTG